MKSRLLLAALLCISFAAYAQLSTVVPPGMTAAQVDAAIKAQTSTRLLAELALRKVNPTAAPCDISQTAAVGVISCFRNGVLLGRVKPGTSGIAFNFDGSQVFGAIVQAPRDGLSPGGGFYARVPAVFQDGQLHSVKAYAIMDDGSQPKFDVFDGNGDNLTFTWAQSIVDSPSGAMLPPLAKLIVAGKPWTVRDADKVVLIDGVATNGHATILKYVAGAMYAKSPSGGIWYKWLGNNAWQKRTTAEPQ